MSHREFNATRTKLANAFAAAGAELVAYMGTDSALAAIPNTEPPKYVVAGTLKMIAKMLPGLESTSPAVSPAPAAAGIEGLTDERIAELNREAQDQGISGIAPSIYLARAIEREILGAHAGVVATEPAPNFWYDANARVEYQHLVDDTYQFNLLVCNERFGNYTTPLSLAAPAAQAPVQNAEEVRRAVLEEAAKACVNQLVEVVMKSDVTFNRAIESCVTAIRALASKEGGAA